LNHFTTPVAMGGTPQWLAAAGTGARLDFSGRAISRRQKRAVATSRPC